ncbi:aminodeoxychorismate synthase component I [Variovorax sp.]|jgi:para-aminobenzoate synthetase|uniref:aminodeoxychorismate synthase component I n=1 Tax=Variovorax sp. TaxID=1871043 RepID=UPI0037D9A2CC
MHTLLIDNYDSFTYNLYQYLAASNGEPPVVVRNDQMRWEDAQDLPFDNIVISPGPGRPQRAADLGISADALQCADVPILGVCLGHQAIAHFCGATVDLARQPMHGRLDQVSHAGCDLFHGIPSPFEAVRYHSLAATELPPDLEELAWAPDGTLMALRHRHRPWWGVQFHPESVCTQFGARLLANFRDLTEHWHVRHPSGADRERHRTASRTSTAAGGRHARLSVHVHQLATFPDPEAVFTQCFADAETAFWLDSSAIDTPQGRFSYMGDARGPAAEVIRYRSAQRELHIERHAPPPAVEAAEAPAVAAPEERSTGSILDYLDAGLAGRSLPPGDWPFEFLGGYVGYFGYELKGELDGNAHAEAATPDAMWIFADRLVAFDHAKKQAWLLCLDQGALSPTNARWLRRMREQLEAQDLGQAPPGSHANATLPNLDWRTALPHYRELILRCQEEIRQGETYEACLTNQLGGSGQIDELGTYRLLRVRNPAPYAAYLKSGDIGVLCASPELFLQLSADGTVESRPIKGTIARGHTTEEDEDNARFLTEDEKTKAENLMIVDLLRNDLTRVCEVGSVHVPRLFHVESFATVHQLVSTIRGRLREGLSAVDCVRATFPGGSMTGAPKVRTMQILDQLENGPRGIYSGSLGFLSLDGRAKLNIVIRTIVSDGQRVTIGSGGAIVAMSDPDAEVDEIVLKARAQVEVLRASGAFSEHTSDVPPGNDPPDGQRH